MQVLTASTYNYRDLVHAHDHPCAPGEHRQTMPTQSQHCSTCVPLCGPFLYMYVPPSMRAGQALQDDGAPYRQAVEAAPRRQRQTPRCQGRADTDRNGGTSTQKDARSVGLSSMHTRAGRPRSSRFPPSPPNTTLLTMARPPERSAKPTARPRLRSVPPRWMPANSNPSSLVLAAEYEARGRGGRAGASRLEPAHERRSLALPPDDRHAPRREGAGSTWAARLDGCAFQSWHGGGDDERGQRGKGGGSVRSKPVPADRPERGGQGGDGECEVALRPL
ncbi:hypothetical protein DCS_05330 [Drechmeria coniospora]|uniref:Uncharacterized protein n=1 Tax=Drechmeria coniospora TaxID=98403 RepID=A0A151GMI1_DRECN|nr:hypothetical protein DCS_05330 [Drechmeria coniospora]KYK58317.1 hypothetical protein DCS_05330 [Drechmeria coniospora]